MHKTTSANTSPIEAEFARHGTIDMPSSSHQLIISHGRNYIKAQETYQHCSEQSRGRSEGSCAEEGEQEKAMAGARERAGELLGRCERTVASLVAQLELVLSPECVEDGGDENIVWTAIAREAGCRRSSA